MTRYFASVNSRDGVSLPTQQEAIPLAEMGAHLVAFLKRYEKQGYFSNCRQERIPLDELTFTIAPENDSHGFFGIIITNQT